MLFQINVTEYGSFNQWMMNVKLDKIRVKQICTSTTCEYQPHIFATYLHTVMCLQIFYCIVSYHFHMKDFHDHLFLTTCSSLYQSKQYCDHEMWCLSKNNCFILCNWPNSWPIKYSYMYDVHLSKLRIFVNYILLTWTVFPLSLLSSSETVSSTIWPTPV